MTTILTNPALLTLSCIAIGSLITMIFIWIFLVPGSKELQESRQANIQVQNEMDSQIEIFIDSVEHIVMIYDDIFMQFKSYLDFYEYRFKLNDPGRTILNRELMYHKIKFWTPVLMKLAEDIDDCYRKCHSSKMTNCDKMSKLFSEAFIAGMEYTKFMHAPDLVSIDGIPYTDHDREIMSRYMVDFVTGIHHSKEVIVEEWIKGIWASKSSPNCLSKARDSFMIYRIAFQMAKVDSENLAEMIGDDYTGEVFLGTIIGPAK